MLTGTFTGTKFGDIRHLHLIGEQLDRLRRTNQAKGYGILNLAWGIGAIGGPIVSGVLAQPCIQYASPNCPQFLQTHPFFLPCVSATLFSSIGVIAAIHLKETNKRVRNKNTTYKKIPPQKLVVNPGDTSIQRQKPADGETQFREMRHFKSSRYDEHMMDINLDECSSNNTTEQKLIVLISPIEESRKEEFGKSAAAVPLSTLPAEPVEEEPPQRPQPQNKPSSSTLDLLRDRDVLLSSFCYSMTGLVFIITGMFCRKHTHIRTLSLIPRQSRHVSGQVNSKLKK